MSKLIDELKSKAEAATPGPWHFHDSQQDGPSDIVYQQVHAEERTGCDEEDCCHNQVCAMPNDSYGYACNFTDNGPYIAAANPQNILKLIEAYEILKEAAMVSRLCTCGNTINCRLHRALEKSEGILGNEINLDK